jgi:iron complex transport system ATP-binding protein
VSASLQVHDVVRAFGGVRAVDGASLEVDAGSITGLIGPNGAGKSSILRAVAGLVEHEGQIAVDGSALALRHARRRAELVAYVPQAPELPAEMTGFEYALLGRNPYIGWFGQESRNDRELVAGVLHRLELDEFADRPLGSMSGGERQRLVIARALAQEAPILLLDEPTSALDLGRQQQALELVDALRRDDQLTVIAAMHDLSLAGQYADRLLLLDRGELVAQGSANEVLSEERIATYYSASVEVLHRNGNVFVLPRREGDPCAR